MTNRNFIRNLALSLIALGGCAGSLFAVPVSAMEYNRKERIKQAREENEKLFKEVFEKFKNGVMFNSRTAEIYCEQIRDNFAIIDKKTAEEIKNEEFLAIYMTKWAIGWINEFQKNGFLLRMLAQVPPFQGKETEEEHYGWFNSAIFQIKCLACASMNWESPKYTKVKEVIERLEKYANSLTKGEKPNQIKTKEDLQVIETIIQKSKVQERMALDAKTKENIRIQEGILKLKKDKEDNCIIV